MTTKRNLFILVLCFFIAANLLAQQKINFSQGIAAKNSGQGILNTSYKSTNNTVLLTQDFSSTTFPPTGWTMNIVTGTLGWSRGVGAQTYATFSTLNTTAANGYAFVNSDGNAGSGGAEHTILRTPAINCVGQNYVWLKFNNYFIQFGAATADVEVSNNGTTWIPVHSAHTGLALNQATPNPQFVDINISAYAANQPTVYVRFKWTGSYDYYWFVDDVEVYAKDPYDVGLTKAANPNEYTLVPKVHYNGQPLTLTATAKNQGGAAISGVQVRFNVYNSANNLIHTAQSTPSGPLAAGSTIDLSVPAFTIPNAIGTYKAECIASMTQQDANHSNDTVFGYFSITDSAYGRDNAGFTSTLDGSLGISSGGIAIMGQNYKLLTPDKLSRVSFYVTGPAIGDTTTMFLYNTMPDGTPATLLAQSNPYKFTTAGAQWVTLTFNTGTVSLDTGTYFIALKDHYTCDNIGLGYTDNNYNPGKAWVKVNENNWQKTEDLGFPCAYVIRAYFVCAGFKPVIMPSANVGLCAGASTTLTATAGTAYLWSPGNQTTQSITVTQPGTYTVSVTNAYGCSALSDAATVTQVNNPVVFLGNDTTVCGVITLNAGAGYANYSWAGGTSSTQYLNVNATGQYIVVVTDSLGCVGLDTINVTVTTGPTINLGPDALLCHYETALLDAGPGYVAYLWSTGAITQTLTVDINTAGLGSHNFSVTVTDNQGCKAIDTINLTFQNCVGVNESYENILKTYPNPVKETLVIDLGGTLQNNAVLDIYNTSGVLVLTQKIEKGNSSISLNLKNLRSGLYLIKLNSGNKTYYKKIIME